MKKLAVFSLCLGSVFAAATSHAVDLKQSKVTQVVNDVQIISAADQKEKAATVNDIFAMPDILRTGAASRAELVAQDETITRVGANTIFSFDPANRTIDLKQGSLLFHSPHGKGGGAIRTGSATASVLGTTLIVVTTPNGGFKVIALEGQVEVHFLNGLKQKLDPGQMTFVLPGANQLSPVILFRLDELTQNSLLVKGFIQTLDSMPLIQNEINKQLKLISSGRATDTGLYAGDDATPNQVEVLDLNTVTGGQKKNNQTQQQSPPPPVLPPSPPPIVPNLDAAKAADATINQASLTDASVPTPPWHIFTDQPFTVSGVNFFNGKMFSGFVARNIFMNTPAANLKPLVVDLTPYSRLKSFDMVAVNDFSFEGSVTFKGLPEGQDLSLYAGDQFLFTPGISIEADAHNFALWSPATMTFDNVGLYNASKDINLHSAADIVFQNNSTAQAAGRFIANAGNNLSSDNSQFTANSIFLSVLNGGISFNNSVANSSTLIFLAPSFINVNNSTINSEFVTMSGTGLGSINLSDTVINAPGAVVISSIGDVTITGTTPEPSVRTGKITGVGSSLNSDPNTGSVTLTSASGSVNVSGTTISAHYLTLNSGDGILLDGSGHTVTAAGTGATANFTAVNKVDVRNVDLTSFATVNMAANTINLLNVAFNGTVSLRSLLGIWNNGSVMSGAVNDLGGVTYNGVTVDAPNGATGQLPNTHITVGKL